VASNFNDSTPAAPAGSLNVIWNTDGAGNDSASYNASVDVGVSWDGVGVNSQHLIYLKMNRAITFPASATNSHASAAVAATGSTTFTYKKAGSSFATVVFSASGTTGAFTQASDAVFASGDLLELVGPATADATLATFGFNLAGYKT
jgi:hypothetical protein